MSYTFNLKGKQVIMSDRDINGVDEIDIISELSNAMSEVSQHKKIKTFFDIGANKGNFSFISLFYPDLKVYSFEPNPNTFETLLENIELNNLKDRVIPFNLGLSNTLGTFELKIPIDVSDNGLSTFAPNPKERFAYDSKSGDYNIINIDCKTLDSVFLQLKLDSLDAIKIDTEGSELNILKGGEGVLRKYKPIIAIEYTNENSGMFGYDRNEIVTLLKSYGYNSFHHINGRDSDLLCTENELEIYKNR